jgi:hypothetical protein
MINSVQIAWAIAGNTKRDAKVTLYSDIMNIIWDTED